MLKHKYIDAICITGIILAVLGTILFINGEQWGLQKASSKPGYVSRLFDKTKVHQIDIHMDDWKGFLANAHKEEYTSCTVVIDGEIFHDVGIRAKGNNSLRLTEKYGHERYSLKLEFDHFKANSYYGLDKLCLDASFQDNSYLKTWITYDMMEHMKIPTPLCSYVWVRAGGEDWGLFLAVEEPEEAFVRRNFGKDHGQLYKPDYKSLEDPNHDVYLQYTDDYEDSYDNIFRNAKFEPDTADKKRLIQALKILASGENLETAVHVDEVLRYFTVQVFVVNLDSYLGKTGHNYFLYEEDGILQIIPWDYNLAFATYSLGMPEPINDSRLYVNYPINTPASGEIMKNRPLYHNLMKSREYYAQYHIYFNQLVAEYFESGHFEKFVSETRNMIEPYVKKDPTAFCTYEEYVAGADTITDFCLLRAQSVRGQLDGTIPSTISGQMKDQDSFVDASSVWLPDMGEIADLKE